jgi:hypothetical protein
MWKKASGSFRKPPSSFLSDMITHNGVTSDSQIKHADEVKQKENRTTPEDLPSGVVFSDYT